MFRPANSEFCIHYLSGSATQVPLGQPAGFDIAARSKVLLTLPRGLNYLFAARQMTFPETLP